MKVLREHMDDLHKISQILIERETIDKDQFVRLLAGESDEDVFEPAPAPEPEPEAKPKPRAPRQPRPFPLPGSAMTGEPEGAG
jgi:cell division protease FtsH